MPSMTASRTTPPPHEAPLRILPLGGLGEIGKNMMVLECGDDIIVVDCGVQFPTEDMPGVDLIIPDVSYLAAQAHRVRGILITHGHEDHIGALPYVLPDLDTPVYAPRLAHGLIRVKLNERQRTRDAEVHVVEPEQPIGFGDNFRATWFRVCHSIPDAMGICIETPWGSVIHTGDFKIDHTPVDGHTIDLPALAERGKNGVLLLFSDSTYAELPGYTPSEQIMGDALDRAVADAPGRVIVATFASLISRIQQVITAAENHDRHVAFVGRSMLANVQMATEMGYLDALPGTIIPVRDVAGLPPERVVLMTTGSQGEPTSALVRIANGDSRDVELMAGDTVVISATPIPGNERAVSQTIDNLLRQGARVLYDRIAPVHVHGHASQEELKLMLNLTRPALLRAGARGISTPAGTRAAGVGTGSGSRRYLRSGGWGDPRDRPTRSPDYRRDSRRAHIFGRRHGYGSGQCGVAGAAFPCTGWRGGGLCGHRPIRRNDRTRPGRRKRLHGSGGCQEHVQASGGGRGNGRIG